MSIVWQYFPFYIILVLLIQLVPVRINIFFVRENIDDFVTIRFNTLYSLLRYSVEIPLLQQKTPLDLTMEAELKAGQDMHVAEKKKAFSLLDLDWDVIRKYLDYFKNNKRIFSFLARFYTRAMTVEKLVLKVRAGVDDAALTGMISGFYWIVTGFFTSLARQWLHLKEQPVFGLSPDFSPEPVFAIRLDTVVSFRIGHFTVMGFLLLLTKIRGGRT
ncbi:MAG: DUF2953 domain-containing protein [Bacillota bacterium]|nr:DUF2953 domain-containing protein [Bacillota bacterium]MDW7684082.1 DUF2953 domain-containing protein [Bacillota bacterium]